MSNNPLAQALATDMEQLYFGGNWTSVNYVSALAPLSFEQVMAVPFGRNSIASLVLHTGYYLQVQNRVLLGGPLQGKDAESWALPLPASAVDWHFSQAHLLTQVRQWAATVRELADEQLWAPFVEEKYGSYYHNLAGLVQHNHYHLGQIKLLASAVGK